MHGYAKWCPCSVGKQARANFWRMVGEARVAKSGLPSRYSFHDLDSFPVCDGNRQAFETISAWAYEDMWWLYVWGGYGSGKTGLACALLRDTAKSGYSTVRFYVVADFLAQLKSCFSQGDSTRAAELVDEARTVDFLVFDDIGAERPTEWAAETLFNVLNHRYNEEKLTVFTSNLNLDQLAQRLDERLVWRIVELATVVKLDGPNLRDRKANRPSGMAEKAGGGN